MKVFAQDTGDHSVGIGENKAMLEINSEMFPINDKENRDKFRQALKQFLTEWFDFQDKKYSFGNTTVWFDDECISCLKPLDKLGKCNNSQCIEFSR